MLLKSCLFCTGGYAVLFCGEEVLAELDTLLSWARDGLEMGWAGSAGDGLCWAQLEMGFAGLKRGWATVIICIEGNQNLKTSLLLTSIIHSCTQLHGHLVQVLSSISMGFAPF